MSRGPEVNVGKVDYEDIRKIIEEQFDNGLDVVWVHTHDTLDTIYITRALMLDLGGYEAVNELVRNTYNTIDKPDPTKTRFYFGQNFTLGNHEVLGLDIHFPRDTSHSFQEIPGKFVEAVEERLKTINPLIC